MVNLPIVQCALLKTGLATNKVLIYFCVVVLWWGYWWRKGVFCSECVFHYQKMHVYLI